MPSAKDSFWLRNAQVLEHVIDPSKTATTLSAAASKGATSVSVASITGITNGASILIGSGETSEWNIVSGSPSGGNVPLANPLGRAHASGENCVPGLTYDFGDPDDSGVKISIDYGSQDVMLSTRRTVLAIVRDYISASMEWTQPVVGLPQIASAMGAKQARVTGSGTTSAPRQLNIDGSTFGEDTNRGVTVIGYLADGRQAYVEFHGVDKDYTGFNMTLKPGQVAAIAHKATLASQIVFAVGTPPTYTVDVSKRYSKALVFNQITEVGLFAATSGVNTTLSSAMAVAATSAVVASSTGAAAADPVLIGAADTGEISLVDSAPDGTHISLRTQVNFAHASGETVVEQQRVPLGGVTDDGVTISFGGTTKEVSLASSRIKGSLPATAALTASLMLATIDPSTMAYVLSVPQSDISSGRVFMNLNIGTADVALMYVRGSLLGGGTLEIFFCGCSQDIKNIAAALSAKDVAKLALALRPTLITFLQY